MIKSPCKSEQGSIKAVVTCVGRTINLSHVLAEGVAEVWRTTRLANIDFAGIAKWLYRFLSKFNLWRNQKSTCQRFNY